KRRAIRPTDAVGIGLARRWQGKMLIVLVGVKAKRRADVIFIDVIDDVRRQLGQPAARLKKGYGRRLWMLVRQDWRHFGDSEQPAIDIVGESLPGRLSEDKLLPDRPGRGIHVERHVEHGRTVAKRERRPKRRGRTAALVRIG